MIRLTAVFFIELMSIWVNAQVSGNNKPSNDYRFYYNKAEEYLADHDYINALIYYNESINLNPLFAEGYQARALVKENQDDIDGAIRDYTLSLELKPNQFEALLSRSLLYFSREEWGKAKGDFEQLLVLPTGETNTVYFKQDRFTSGVNEVISAQGSDKAYLFNYLGLSEMGLMLYEPACQAFDSAIAIHPYNSDYQVNLGICKEAMNDYKGAKIAYQTALQLDPDNALAQHNYGLLIRKSGLSDDAAKILDEIIEKNPNLPFAYAERASTELSSGELAKALIDYTEAIRLAPKFIDYWLSRGMVKEKMQNWTGAYDDYSYAIQLDEKNPKGWLHRGNLLYQKEKYAEAIKDYDVALILDNAYDIAYHNRGLAKYRIGERNSACKDIKYSMTLGFKVQPQVLNKICQN